jgi:pimeloyl-ACP methyl ester carboxylesterase
VERLIAAGKRVLAVDAPAHGASTGKLFNMLQYSRVVAVLAAQFQPQHMVGHSIGGGAAALYLHEHPNHPFKKAVIMGTPSELRHMANTFANILGLSQRMRRAMERRFQEQYQLNYDDVSIARYCKNIHLPTLIIHDNQDSIAPVADAYRYQENLRQGQLLITNGLGHSLQGTAVYNGILAFLED